MKKVGDGDSSGVPPAAAFVNPGLLAQDSALVASPAPSGSSPEPFVDAAAGAEFLKINPRTLQRLARQQRVPAYPLGSGRRKTWRFLLSELYDWMRGRLNCFCHSCHHERR
jgi:hypothetical protein